MHITNTSKCRIVIETNLAALLCTALIYNYCCMLIIVSLTDYQTCEVTTIMYHDTFEWYISCMAILQGVIYSRSVAVILEYVDLLRDIGSRVFATRSCLSWLRFIVTSIVFNTLELLLLFRAQQRFVSANAGCRYFHGRLSQINKRPAVGSGLRD